MIVFITLIYLKPAAVISTNLERYVTYLRKEGEKIPLDTCSRSFHQVPCYMSRYFDMGLERMDP